MRAAQIEIGGRQQRLVLAMLLVHRNEVVSVDRLVDALWGEQPPANAVKNIQIHVSRLRKALEAERRTGERVAGGAVVRTLSERLCPRGRLRRAGRRPVRAASRDGPTGARSGRARAGRGGSPGGASVWRGPPLADFAYDSFAQGEIARLEELRLAAVEEQIDVELAFGRHGDVTARLHALVADHPLRERLRADLMLALYRGGRKADALRVYEEARRMLAEELGLEPSESLRRLHSAVLADDPALAAPERVPPTSDTPGRARSPLPLVHPSQQDVARRRRGLAARRGARGGASHSDTRSNLCRDRLSRAELAGRDRPRDESGRGRDSGRRQTGERHLRPRAPLGCESRRRHGLPRRSEGRAGREDDPNGDGARGARSRSRRGLGDRRRRGHPSDRPRLQQGRRADPDRQGGNVAQGCAGDRRSGGDRRRRLGGRGRVPLDPAAISPRLGHGASQAGDRDRVTVRRRSPTASAISG